MRSDSRLRPRFADREPFANLEPRLAARTAMDIGRYHQIGRRRMPISALNSCRARHNSLWQRQRQSVRVGRRSGHAGEERDDELDAAHRPATGF
jgi:hypothetical protein